MMRYTENYNLKKPEELDPVDIQDLNYNADTIDGKIKEIEDWQVNHLQTSNPHNITTELIGAETPAGAQAKVDEHEQKAAPHSGHETPAGAQEKANAALAEAKLYAENVAISSANSALNNANNYTNQVAVEINQRIDETRVKVINVEKNISDISKALTNLNPDQEAKQSVSGYGILSLPKNAANGQISVTLRGLTATNIVRNGNFANGTTDWLRTYATSSVTGNILSITGDGSGNSPFAVQQNPNHKFVTGKKYYMRAIMRVTNSQCTNMSIRAGINGTVVAVQVSPVANNWYVLSGIWTVDEANNGLQFDIRLVHLYPDANTANGKVMEIKEVMAIDLTAHGLENKTKEELDKMFANWFEGTKSTVSSIRAKSVGKNLFNKNINFAKYNIPSRLELTKVQIDGRPNVLKIKANNTHNLVDLGIKFKPNTSYVFKFDMRGTYDIGSGWDASLRIIYTDGSYASVDIRSSQWQTETIITPQDKSIDCIAFRSTNGFSDNYASYIDLDTFQIEEGDTATEYEPYKESVAYITAKDPETGETLELRSLPNGTKDEIRLTDKKLIKRIGTKTNIASGTIINYADMATGGQFVAYFADGTQQVGVKGDTITALAVTLTYQLAEPVEIPVQVSGTLLSYPSGTVYVENIVADVGLYSDGITVLHQDLPIKSIEKISKIDYETGLETILDASKAVIASDKLSFTHPDLKDGDIVFFTYEYDRESTEGETEIEYYDSRYVIKDSVTEKFYKWHIAVADGVPSIELTEV